MVDITQTLKQELFEMDKKRSLIVSCASISSGGAERVLSILSQPLADRYDDVTYVMWVEAPIFYHIDSRVRLVSIEKEIGSKNELKRMKWFRSFIKREKPDLILSFLEPWNIRVLVSTMGLDVKTIVAERNDPHGVNKYWIMDQMEKLIYRRADMIFVQTETIRAFFDGPLQERTRVIYNPVNIPEELVGKALVTPKKKRIVSVARLKTQKRHDMLIRAFAKFYKSHPDYTLTIYGNGPLMNQLKQLAASLGLGDVISIPGASKTIHQDILDAEMMCLVSTREGMSNAMIEAMCLGLPCICTKVSGAIDLIENDKNGILIEVDDEVALYKQMCRVVENKDFAKALGTEASHLYEKLRVDKISKQWIEHIDLMMNKK